MDQLNESDYPDYLSKEFFETALSSGLKSANISVTSFKLSMGSMVGDNYCSEIYRAIVYYKCLDHLKEQMVPLIVKAIPPSGARGSIMDELNVFEKELDVYNKMMPKLSKILHGEFLAAKLYYATKQPLQLIVFQDLKSLGYIMAERQLGLDETHCKIALEKLAKMHAASVILAEKEPRTMDMYDRGMFVESMLDSPVLDGMVTDGLSSLIDIASTWPGYEKIVEKMKTVKVDITRKLTKFCNSTPSSIKVLNHGDMWVNNIMYKYEEGRPIDTVFLDYQMSFFSSPGIDLNYFLCTSPNYEVRETKRDDLLDFYIQIFIDTLCTLGCKQCPTVETMRKEVSSREFYGFFASFAILPLVLLNKENSKDSSIESLVDQQTAANLRKLMYSEPNYQRAAKALINRFDRLKLFDQNC